MQPVLSQLQGGGGRSPTALLVEIEFSKLKSNLWKIISPVKQGLKQLNFRV